MNKEKKSKIDILNNIIGIEGLLITGKYLMMLILATISISYMIEFGINFNSPNNPMVKLIILCSVVLIPIYLSCINLIDIYGETNCDIVESQCGIPRYTTREIKNG